MVHRYVTAQANAFLAARGGPAGPRAWRGNTSQGGLPCLTAYRAACSRWCPDAPTGVCANSILTLGTTLRVPRRYADCGDGFSRQAMGHCGR